jgi:epoxyqueuosine reductase
MKEGGGEGERESASARVRARAGALGFDAVAIARVGEGIEADFGRYEAFVAAGMQGEMGWLAKYAEVRRRLDGEGILSGARSVVCVARRYQRPPGPGDEEVDRGPGLARAIARYARGRDYHAFLRRRLRRLATFVRTMGDDGRPVQARPLLDDDPVLERAWAAKAGLGFVGKNGMLIVPGLGSMVLLAEVVTTLELEPGDAHGRPPVEGVAHRCGSCTRCLEACPTRAFDAPFVLDPRRCVSYLTIEHRTAVPVQLREAIGEHLFGCDDCQTVCPFNAGAVARSPLPDDDGDPFAPLERWSRLSLEELLTLDEPQWQTVSEGTPIRRVGRAGIARNAAMVLGNRRDPRSVDALERASRAHDDPIVRDAAAWAVERVRTARSEDRKG